MHIKRNFKIVAAFHEKSITHTYYLIELPQTQLQIMYGLEYIVLSQSLPFSHTLSHSMDKYKIESSRRGYE